MLTLANYVIFGIGALLLAAWLGLYVKGYRSAVLFEPLVEKEYPLKEIYFVGLALIEAVKYPYKSKSDRKLRREVSVLYGERYADYYLRVVYAQKLTMALTVAVLAFVLYGLANHVAALGVMLIFSGLAYYYFGTVTEKKILKRSEEMLRDFSEVISKLALLTNAGMILREAWEEVAYTGTATLYLEMQRAVDEMKNGEAEVDALFEFGVRCVIPEIKKFTSTLVQGLVKGNSELAFMLKEQSKEVWAAKKQNVRRQGEKAASKLLIPISLMFVGILIMVIVPIFASIGA
ncbi:MAG: type II secretion system F family protein [Oscillospiraceae bacterium]|jgi:tight adherence protein C|nr:type II secretion system F family protein [Oscillospiraceae bacterium]